MNPVEVLRREHEALGVELSELDFIMDGVLGCVSDDEGDGEINYPNLVHTFWKVCEFWNVHERMEEEIFRVLEKAGFQVPIDAIFLEHEDLRKQVKNIGDAINSGSDFEMRKVLGKDMREFVDFLRKHAEAEDDVLFSLVPGDFGEEVLGEIKRIVGKYQ